MTDITVVAKQYIDQVQTPDVPERKLTHNPLAFKQGSAGAEAIKALQASYVSKVGAEGADYFLLAKLVDETIFKTLTLVVNPNVPEPIKELAALAFDEGYSTLRTRLMTLFAAVMTIGKGNKVTEENVGQVNEFMGQAARYIEDYETILSSFDRVGDVVPVEGKIAV